MWVQVKILLVAHFFSPKNICFGRKWRCCFAFGMHFSSRMGKIEDALHFVPPSVNENSGIYFGEHDPSVTIWIERSSTALEKVRHTK